MRWSIIDNQPFFSHAYFSSARRIYPCRARALNNYHPNFKFTINYSKLEIPFLDVKVCKINNNLETTLYTKSTDKKLYLNYLSEHTEHIKKSIPFSQMLRLKRIISSESELNFHLDKMTVNFINRKC